MRTVDVTLPQLGLIASTRGMLGAGIGLLIANLLNAKQRRAVGWTLVGVGIATTIPLAITIISDIRDNKKKESKHEHNGHSPRASVAEPERQSMGQEL